MAAAAAPGITLRVEGDAPDAVFEHDDGRAFASLTDGDAARLMAKWGLRPGDGCVGRHYRCPAGGPLRRGQEHELLVALLNAAALRSTLPLPSAPAPAPAPPRGGGPGGGGCGGGGGSPPWPSFPTAVATVRFAAVSCGETTLDMLDKAVNGDVVRSSGRVVGMPDVFLPGGVTVSDQLRATFMLGDEAEFSDTFDDRDRGEFLFHVMRRLVAGGALCQWEDEYAVYKDMCRTVYRDMVSVARRPGAGGGLETRTVVLQVLGAADAAGVEVPLFPCDDGGYGNHNWMYVAVHQQQRRVSVWYHAFSSSF